MSQFRIVKVGGEGKMAVGKALIAFAFCSQWSTLFGLFSAVYESCAKANITEVCRNTFWAGHLAHVMRWRDMRGDLLHHVVTKDPLFTRR
jgi:hypothetical protein